MFAGGTPEGVRAAMEQLRSQISDGPPPGVKSTGLTMLADPDGGRVIWIGIFESEDDLRESEKVLERMEPPGDMGTRRSVEVYEVGADVRI